MLLEISDKVHRNTFFIAILGYVCVVISIFFYYFNFSGIEPVSAIFSLVIFPIFFIAITSQNLESSKATRAELEGMDIDTYLKPYSTMFSDKPSWLMFGLSLTFIYSFVSFFYWTSFGKGAMIEEGQFIIYNHGIVKAITEEKFYELKRSANIGQASHYLAFYAITIWFLYRKEYGTVIHRFLKKSS